MNRKCVSATLAKLLRESTEAYQNRWIARTKDDFATDARPEIVAEHRQTWESIARAVETGDYDELLAGSREAGRLQSRLGIELAEAVKRAIRATNMIESALLAVNDGALLPSAVLDEIGELRTMIAMAVAEGYETENSAKNQRERDARLRLRAALLARPDKYPARALAPGDEIEPLYDAGTRLHFVEAGKLRLYNLLPTGRTITLSILSADDAFFQWRAEASTLSCLCAEAMGPSRVVSVAGDDLGELIGAHPSAAFDVVAAFARRLTESHVLIEDLLGSTVDARLYRTLLELAKQFGRTDGDATLIDVPLTHQRLADMIGSNRVTVTRKMHDLVRRGVVESRGNQTIAVRRLDLLDRLVAEAGETPTGHPQ